MIPNSGKDAVLATDPGALLQTRALDLIEEATKEGLILRLLGSIAIRVICARGPLELFVGRRQYHDIDLMGYRKQVRQIIRFFENRGFTLDSRSRLESDDYRLYLEDGTTNTPLDIFLDRLEMCRTLDLRERLSIASPTIPPADLLLSKFQRVDMRDVDIRDALCLLSSLELGPDDTSAINVDYLTELLCGQWSFWTIVKSNLDKTYDALHTLAMSDKAQLDSVNGKILMIEKRLDEGPKSLRWRARALFGTAIRYHSPVE